MSKECMDYCPRISNILDNLETDNVIAGVSPIHPNISGADELVEACKESYDCLGPQFEDVEVKKGIFKKRIEIERKAFCGLDNNSQA